MKIIIKENGGKNIHLLFPTSMILNSITAGLIQKYTKLNITREQAVMLIKELKRYKREHKDWVLVEVKSSNGDYVKIKL